ADNLRSYPVIVVFYVAITYLWTAPTSGNIPVWLPKAFSIIWGGWTLLFFMLTAAQSGVLIILAIVDFLKSHDLISRPRIKMTGIVIGAILAVTFASGAWFVAQGILHGIRK
ncbi:MAG: hypothetical protein REI95_09945, partial [Oxalicibacterium faecigallinarum]|uniref:hypothetical protein n=1 Tax=Oxalicibacterium faecigallinarum TaxID=573741 RepID=UPI002809DF9E